MIVLYMTVKAWHDIQQALDELDELYRVDLRKATDIERQQNEDQIADLECALAASWKDIWVVGTISRNR